METVPRRSCLGKHLPTRCVIILTRFWAAAPVLAVMVNCCCKVGTHLRSPRTYKMLARLVVGLQGRLLWHRRYFRSAASHLASVSRSSAVRSLTLEGGMALLHTEAAAISRAEALMRAGVSSSTPLGATGVPA